VFSPAIEEQQLSDDSTTTAPSETTTTTDEVSDSPEALGEGGIKALTAERRRANAAEKEAKALKARLDEIEAAKLSDTEKADRRAAEAEARAIAAEASAQRFRIATRFGMTDEEADVILTGPDEDTMVKQAELFTARTKQAKPEGVRVPAEGKVPAPPALNSDDLESALKAKLNIR